MKAEMPGEDTHPDQVIRLSAAAATLVSREANGLQTQQ